MIRLNKQQENDPELTTGKALSRGAQPRLGGAFGWGWWGMRGGTRALLFFNYPQQLSLDQKKRSPRPRDPTPPHPRPWGYAGTLCVDSPNPCEPAGSTETAARETGVGFPSGFQASAGSTALASYMPRWTAAEPPTRSPAGARTTRRARQDRRKASKLVTG